MIKYLIIYFCIISLLAAFLTISDKKRAIKGKWRISEKALFTAAIFGGAAVEYITMKSIHHKTNHRRFMLGLPAIIIIQIAISIFIILKVA